MNCIQNYRMINYHPNFQAKKPTCTEPQNNQTGQTMGFSKVVDLKTPSQQLKQWIKDHPEDINARAMLSIVNLASGENTDHGKYTKAVTQYMKDHYSIGFSKVDDLEQYRVPTKNMFVSKKIRY